MAYRTVALLAVILSASGQAADVTSLGNRHRGGIQNLSSTWKCHTNTNMSGNLFLGDKIGAKRCCAVKFISSEIQMCRDPDELPAWQGHPYAQTAEVVGPYSVLCRVPVPQNYTSHYYWPQCLWKVPSPNIPRAQAWSNIKAGQHWVKHKGDVLELPRGGGSMPSSRFLEMLPDDLNMTSIRTVLDEGAGVCGLAAEIMITYKHDPLVLSYAPHDSHASQIQVCAERGLPAIIFSLGRYQFPVPPSSFDMVTCKWCWHWVVSSSIGTWLLEVDRVLRPGGYFVFYADVWEYHNFRSQVEHWTSVLGWSRLANSGRAKSEMAVFQKPEAQALQLLAPGAGAATKPAGIPMPSCHPDDIGQPSFRKFHVPCRITNTPAELTALALETAARHSYDSSLVSGSEAPLPGLSPAATTAHALRVLKSMAPEAPVLSVLDGTPHDGALGEALRQAAHAEQHTWVLHVQPVTTVEFMRRGSTSFGGVSNVVHSVGDDLLLNLTNKRGRLGLYHDWCYMFPMYPRAFDLIVFDRLVCRYWCLTQFMLELDRLVRPGGYIALGDPGQHLTDDAVAPLGWEPVTVLSAENALKAGNVGGAVPKEQHLKMWRKSLSPPPPMQGASPASARSAGEELQP